MIQPSQPYLTFGSVHLFKVTHYEIDNESSPLKFPMFTINTGSSEFSELSLTQSLSSVGWILQLHKEPWWKILERTCTLMNLLLIQTPITLESWSHSHIWCEIDLFIFLWRKSWWANQWCTEESRETSDYKNRPTVLSPFLGSVLLIGVLLFQDNCHHWLSGYYLWVIWKLLKDKTIQL